MNISYILRCYLHFNTVWAFKAHFKLHLPQCHPVPLPVTIVLCLSIRADPFNYNAGHHYQLLLCLWMCMLCARDSAECVCGGISRMYNYTGSAGEYTVHTNPHRHTFTVSQNWFIKALPVELLGLDPMKSHRPLLNYQNGREQRERGGERGRSHNQAQFSLNHERIISSFKYWISAKQPWIWILQGCFSGRNEWNKLCYNKTNIPSIIFV